jgi:hypothetical protein
MMIMMFHHHGNHQSDKSHRSDTRMPETIRMMEMMATIYGGAAGGQMTRGNPDAGNDNATTEQQQPQSHEPTMSGRTRMWE